MRETLGKTKDLFRLCEILRQRMGRILGVDHSDSHSQEIQLPPVADS